MIFRAVHWEKGRDVEDEEGEGPSPPRTYHVVDVFGKTVDGRSVCVRVPVRPYFYFELPLSTPPHQLARLLQDLRKGMRELGHHLVGHGCIRGRSFVGAAAPASSGFCKLSFVSAAAARKAAAWFRYKAGFRTTLYEANVDSTVRLLQDRGVAPCDDVVLEACDDEDIIVSDDEKMSTCDIEVRLGSEDALRALPHPRSPPPPAPPSASVACGVSSPAITAEERERRIVIASFDIECVCPSGGFPDASRPEDAIILVCTAFSRLGEELPYRQVAIALAPDSNAAVERGDGGGSGSGSERGDIELVCEREEAQVLGAWARLLAEERVDVLTGYNIWGFDMRYIHRRVLLNGGVMHPALAGFARDLGRIRDAGLVADSARVKGAGATSGEATSLATPGVLQLDLYYYAKRFLPGLDSYKLSGVCEAFLGAAADDNKTGMTIPEMNAAWAHGPPERRWDVVLYCAQDARLVTRLLERLAALRTVFEMANVCGVPPSVVLLQGEQVKVYSLILRGARAAGMFCPSTSSPPSPAASSAAPPATAATSRRQQQQQQQQQKRQTRSSSSLLRQASLSSSSAAGKGGGDAGGEDAGNEREEGVDNGHEGEGDDDDDDDRAHQLLQRRRLQGATVMEPRKGAYWEPVVCLDFQSLYPSIIMAHNLCPSTLSRQALAARFASAREEEADLFGRVLPALAQGRQEDQKEGKTGREGVLPRLLRELQTKRAEAKAAMADAERAGDAYLRSLYNAKQQAYKVSMNSVYGFCGASEERGILPCPRVASSITAIGRAMIARTRDYIEREFSCDDQRRPCVIYGDTDSVMVRFPSSCVEECVALGRRAAQEVSDLFPRPVKLCYEKCYMPYLLFSKKRYAGLTRPERCVDCKGVQAVRRDVCPFVRGVCERALDDLLHRADVGVAIEGVRAAARELLEGSVPVSELVMRKSVCAGSRRLLADEQRSCLSCGGPPGSCGAPSSDVLSCRACGATRTLAYKNMQLPAVQAALRMERDPALQGPKSGDVVEFIYCGGGGGGRGGGGSCCERARHVEDAARAGLCADPLFYFHHQLKNPLLDLFRLVLPDDNNAEARKCPERFLFGELMREHETRVDKQPRLTSFFGRADETDPSKKKQ